MIYKLKGSKIKVILEELQVEEIVSFVRLAQSKETGGILLGNYEDFTTAIVKSIIGPPSDSKCRQYSFVRGINGLSAILQKAWKRNEYYLGEWHYHPNGTVMPSFQDLNQMEKNCKKQSL